MALDHNFGMAHLTREDVHWPGGADEVRKWIDELQQQWRAALANLADEQLQACDRTKWPMQGRPLSEIFAWANLELMKNAAEIGYARFLYAVRTG
jgi:hypothetical protein